MADSNNAGTAFGRSQAAPREIRTPDGVRLFHRDWGTGKPVVFVASWSLPSDSWAYQMLALREAGFRCVAYDRRGHGSSEDPGRGFDLDTLADDLAAVLEALDLREATLVGFSMGGAEIVRYLARHGTSRVSRVALVGSTTPALARSPDNPDGVDPASFEAFRRDALMRDFPGWIDEAMIPFVTADVSPGLRGWVRDMALRTSALALVECNRALTTADQRSELRALTLPALVIHGTADATCPLDLTGRRTAALMPGARLVTYDDAPHGLFLTHRDRLNADLVAFAGGAEPRGGRKAA
jgi:non-heme chloroperoxidase